MTPTGSGHRGILRKAKDFPKDFGLVYFFGSHDLCVFASLSCATTECIARLCSHLRVRVCSSGAVRLKKGLTLKPWDCAEKDKLLKGVPNHLVKKKGQLDDLKLAIQEAEVRLHGSLDRFVSLVRRGSRTSLF